MVLAVKMKKTNMKKTLLAAFVLMLGFGFNSNAQDFAGFRQSNYSGVSGGDINPANIADNRMVVDVTLGGFSFSGYNNHIYMNPYMMPYWWSQTFGATDSTDAGYQYATDPNFGNIIPSDSTADYMNRNEGVLFEYENGAGKARRAYMDLNVDIMNVMVSINRTMAVSLGIKQRTFVNLDHLSPELVTLAQNSLEWSDLWNTELDDQLLNISMNSWMEYNLGFAMTVYDEEEHFVKAGVKMKFLQGLGAFYLYTDDVQYNFKNDDTLLHVAGDFNYGYSANVDKYFDANNTDFIGGSGANGELEFGDVFQLSSKLGIGFDLGFVYEWRPDWEDYKYDMDGETNLWRRDKEKYKLKFSFAINDIGGMRYEKSQHSRDFNVNVDVGPSEVLSLFMFDDVNSLSSFNDVIDDSLVNKYGYAEYATEKGSFYMNLPTHINMGLDWNIWRDFYLNVHGMIGFQMNKDAHKVRYPTNIMVTPRYDFAWAGLALPITYSGMYGFRTGLGLRMGPIIIGTGDMKWIFAPGKDKKLGGMDIYAALKVPILYGHPKDIDEDKVSDKLDICIETPGVWEFQGCPDTDMDGIQDSEDACPTEPGPKEFNGCPDRDGDKIIDKNDDCPDDAGLAEFNGCPDKDGDKIMDKDDECPEVPGLEIFKGCPDTDGDGLKDSDDLCPEVAGPKENQGCPDTDNDGIFDYLDACPTEAGPEENRGCPWPDTDGDGLLDKDDMCPYNAGPPENDGCPYTDTDGDGVIDKEDECVNTPGPVENKGCPVVDIEIIKQAFDNLQFETSRAVILQSSYESLEGLAQYLIDNPDFRIMIAGHTDSQGAAQSNLILSKKRAEAVRDFLVQRGVNTDRIIVQFYGEEKPIDTNDTPEGRQNNRRVEMEIIFE